MRPRNVSGLSYNPETKILTIRTAKWKVLGFRNPKKGELYINWSGNLFHSNTKFERLEFCDTATWRNVEILCNKLPVSVSTSKFDFFQVVKKIIPKLHKKCNDNTHSVA